MRVTPTKEQLSYLVFIGVSLNSISQPSSVTANPLSLVPDDGSVSSTEKSGTSKVSRWRRAVVSSTVAVGSILFSIAKKIKRVGSWMANRVKTLLVLVLAFTIIIGAESVNSQDIMPTPELSQLSMSIEVAGELSFIPTPIRTQPVSSQEIAPPHRSSQSPLSLETIRELQLVTTRIVLDRQVARLETSLRKLEGWSTLSLVLTLVNVIGLLFFDHCDREPKSVWVRLYR
ncbi:MAG: hypothetical protein HY731_12245 [Candidatus Tectomicrobia bacterium]|nr:hypothetical protein [Candidatus Tectomicrobia bacterium]